MTSCETLFYADTSAGTSSTVSSDTATVQSAPRSYAVTAEITVGGDYYYGDLPGAIETTQYFRTSLSAGSTYWIQWNDIDNAVGEWTDVEVGLIRESNGRYVQDIVDNYYTNGFIYTVPAGAEGNYIVAVRKRELAEYERFDLRVIPFIAAGADYTGDLPGEAGIMQSVGVSLEAGKTYMIYWIDTDNAAEDGFTDIAVGLINSSYELARELDDRYYFGGNRFYYTVPVWAGGNHTIIIQKIGYSNESRYILRVTEISNVSAIEFGAEHQGNLTGPIGSTQYLSFSVPADMPVMITWEDFINQVGGGGLTEIKVGLINESMGIFIYDIDYYSYHFIDYWSYYGGDYLLVIEKAGEPSASRYRIRVFLSAG